MAETSAASGAGSSLVQAMNLGSGVDIQALATSLAQAENQPRIDSFTKKKEETSVSVSGYGSLKSSVALIKTAFDNLKNISDVTNKLVTNPKPETAAVSIGSQAELRTGSYDITVDQLATGTIIRSKAFGSKSSLINSGAPFTIDFSIGSSSPVTSSVSVTTDTPEGIVSAVNAANIGITARVVARDTDNSEWVILYEGATGTDNDFTIASDATIHSTEANAGKLQTAQNSSVTMNGLELIQRATNKLTDVIPGLELSLASVDANPIKISISDDTSVLRAAIDDLVYTYNAFRQTATELTTTDEETGEVGALESDKSLVSMVQAQVKNLLDLDSSTASGGLSKLRDLGINVKLSGDLAIDEKTFSAALAGNLSDILTMLTADTDNQTDFDAGNKGLALDASLVLKDMLASTGAITSRQVSAETKVVDYEKRLEDLEKRLAATQQRYITQFAAMESLVQRSKSTGDYLKGQFTAMENMYKN